MFLFQNPSSVFCALQYLKTSSDGKSHGRFQTFFCCCGLVLVATSSFFLRAVFLLRNCFEIRCLIIWKIAKTDYCRQPPFYLMDSLSAVVGALGETIIDSSSISFGKIAIPSAVSITVFALPTAATVPRVCSIKIICPD
jgi:hypothetical protein